MGLRITVQKPGTGIPKGYSRLFGANGTVWACEGPGTAVFVHLAHLRPDADPFCALLLACESTQGATLVLEKREGPGLLLRGFNLSGE